MSLIWGRVLLLTGDDWTARSLDSTMTISRATQAVEVLQDNLQGFRSVVSGSYTLTAHLLLLGKGEGSLSFCVCCTMPRQEMPGFGLILLPVEGLESFCGFHGKRVASASLCQLLWCLLSLPVRLDKVEKGEIPQIRFSFPHTTCRGTQGKPVE